MVSKTRMEEFVRHFRWSEVRDALVESPELLAVRDKRGRNWLHICCGVEPGPRGLDPADAVRTAEVLLDAGLDVNGEAFREGGWKATPLWHAVGRGRNLTLARYLLERGSDPNHCLWAASHVHDIDAIRMLVGAGAEVDAVAEQETPFLGAVKHSHFDAAEVLAELGADVDFIDPKGMTALHYMLKKNSDAPHFRMLMRFRPRGDIPNADGVTAAELMARKRNPAFKEMAAQLATR